MARPRIERISKLIGAAYIWFACLAVGFCLLMRFFVTHQVTPIVGCLMLLAYVPVMMFGLVIAMCSVPTGFHIRE